jgi:outer membrane protein
MNRPLLVATLCAGALHAGALHAAGRRTVSLADALATADANLPALRGAQADTLAAKATADIALSPLLPQLTGNAAYQRATGNFAPRPGSGISTPAGSSTATFNYFNFGLNLSQTLFDAPTFLRWRSTLAAFGAQKQVLQGARLDAAYNVRVAFFNAQAMAALLGVARQTLTNQERHLAQIQGFVDVGTRPEIDLAQSKTDVANAKVALITAENNADAAKAQLNLAMGVETDTEYDLGEGRADSVDLEDQGIGVQFEVAAKERPELLVFEERLHAQRLLLRSNRWGYAPVLGASTGISDAGIELSNMGWNWNLQVGLTWSLFSGLGTYRAAQQAEAQLASLEAARDGERLQVRLEIERARLAVRAAKETVIAAAEALENAQLREKLAEGRYKAGVGNSLELSDAELGLAYAGAQRVQADFNLGNARAGLLRALGRR